MTTTPDTPDEAIRRALYLRLGGRGIPPQKIDQAVDQVRADLFTAGLLMAAPTEEQVLIPRPVVPHGPANLTEDEGTAHYIREVVRKIDTGYLNVGGSNVTATIRKLLLDAAAALTAAGVAPQELACGRFDTSHGSCTRSLDHDGPCAPPTDREKLITEAYNVVTGDVGIATPEDALDVLNRLYDAAALAAQPVLDPEKVAATLFNLGVSSARIELIASDLCEAAKRGELS